MKNGLLNYEKVIAQASNAKKYGIIFQATDDMPHNGTTITLNGVTRKFFGNGDFLGLQHDTRVKSAAMQALEKYGIMLANSRSYTYNHLYEILQEKMSKIFGQPTAITNCTSFASTSAIPMMIGPKDVIVLDHQVHNTVMLAATLAGAQGTKILKIAHSDLNQLKDIIQKEKSSCEKIWYLFDGVYSMLGDRAPLAEIREMLDDYEQFYAFCDDAWGMSWIGQYGRGFALSQGNLHPKMLIVSSLSKGFGAGGGGVAIFNNEIHRNIVRDLGSSQIFSAPVTNVSLAAANASADIHLSSEMETIQSNFISRVAVMHETAKSLGIKIASPDYTPIIFVPIGNSEATMFIAEKIKLAGYYVNIAVYPLVSDRLSGIRILPNNYVSVEDCKNIMIVMGEAMHEAFINFDMSGTVYEGRKAQLV